MGAGKEVAGSGVFAGKLVQAANTSTNKNGSARFIVLFLFVFDFHRVSVYHIRVIYNVHIAG